MKYVLLPSPTPSPVRGRHKTEDAGLRFKVGLPRALADLAAPQVLKIVVHAATAPEPTNRRRQSIV